MSLPKRVASLLGSSPDVRTSAAFGIPPGIPGALPVALDRDPLRLPDVARNRPIVVYCL